MKHSPSTSPINTEQTIALTAKDVPKYFDFYRICATIPYHQKSLYDSNSIYYKVLYSFEESFYDFVITSEEISYTKTLFDNFNVFIFLTMSDYSFKLGSSGIEFQDGNEEYLKLHLEQYVHKNHYTSEGSNPIYMQQEYYGGMLLLPKQYILKDIEFIIEPRTKNTSSYVCDKFFGVDTDSIFSPILITPSLAKKHGFQYHGNRYLY